MNDEYDSVQWNVHATTDALPDRNDPHLMFSPNSQHNYYNDNQSIDASGTTSQFYAEPNNGSPLANSPKYNTQSTATHSQSSTSHSPKIESVQNEQTEEAKEAMPMIIRVEDPQKRSEGTSSYVAYLIATNTTVQTFSSPQPRPVRRRFHDFIWLHDVLALEFPASVVPPLPEKHRMKYVKGDRFSSEFIERRRLGLQWFMDRIARHPYLQQSQSTRLFLESADFKNDQQAQSRRVPRVTSVLDTLSDTLLNAFVKVKKPDERFVDMKENVDKLHDNLDTVEKLYSRISKRQQGNNFSASIKGLSMIEKDAAQPLQQFAKSIEEYSIAMASMNNKEELHFLNDVHELLAYCNATKEVLHERDQKQVDFEELSNYLQRAIQERERIMYPGRNMGDGSGLNITEFMADKMNEVRGTDSNRAREERLLRLQAKINELQEEVARTNDANNYFSSQMVREFDIFQGAKSRELKQGLASYADCHIEFCQKGISIWENIIPVLEQIKIDGDKEEYQSNEQASTSTMSVYEEHYRNREEDAESEESEDQNLPNLNYYSNYNFVTDEY
ncbi:hypothetical protein J3Q64DRAFT_1835825 [Phycomyces blakesleeanus]|uniref:Sorting nexin-4 n=1 Tax=Phycomyces blakesleeanus TaxID=4837 RepID=A0ABR3AXE8_PHYBL